MRSVLTVLLLSFTLPGCDRNAATGVSTGMWRAVIEIQGKELPFNFELVNTKDGGYHAYILNAGERLRLDDITIKGDSIDMPLHIFDANLKARIAGDSMTGIFIKNYEKDYRLPFRAACGQRFRFEKGRDDEHINYDGKYEVTFYDSEDTTAAIGLFEQIGDSVTGTFLTPTGDYRYLQGNVANGKLQLSTFDGNYAYLFTANMKPDGSLAGDFTSGKTYKATWSAIRNENATLPDAESLTYLKDGYETIEFSFPDIHGKEISLTDKKYKDKVVILQLLGSWCPNCMDETQFLAPWYRMNKDRGVEIIGLAYERKDDFTYASTRIKNMIEKMDVGYDIVIAGTNDKAKASATLPMLNGIAAFPTTIFIGKDGKVKKIHTGFSGPGTGVYYEQFKEEFNIIVNELLSEQTAYK